MKGHSYLKFQLLNDQKEVVEEVSENDLARTPIKLKDIYVILLR